MVPSRPAVSIHPTASVGAVFSSLPSGATPAAHSGFVKEGRCLRKRSDTVGELGSAEISPHILPLKAQRLPSNPCENLGFVGGEIGSPTVSSRFCRHLKHSSNKAIWSSVYNFPIHRESP